MGNKHLWTIVLGILVLIMLNVVSQRFFLRFDLTEDKRFTLSQATEDILQDLVEPVTISAYITEQLPQNVARSAQDFQNMLVEYANKSKGMVAYEIKDPAESEELEQEALQSGIQPVLVDVREKDQATQQKVYIGAVIQLGEQSEVIPFVPPGAAMEYALSTAIKKLAVLEKPAIGLVQGHGEPTIQSLQSVNNALSILYSLESVTLDQPVPDRFNTLALLAPTDSLPLAHFQALDAFLQRGGNLFVGINRVDGDLQNSIGNEQTTGLETWLEGKGIRVEPNFVIDAKAGAVTVQQQRGPFMFNSQVQFPYLPIVSTFAAHPITKGLEAVIFPFVSQLTFVGDSSLKFTPIVFSSERSGTSPVPTFFDVTKEWQQSDFPLSDLTVGAVLEGPIAGATNARLVVIGDGDFAQAGGQSAQSDNASLMVNSIDWLSDDTGLIELRTKGISFRPIKELEEAEKQRTKYFNFFFPIFLVIGYGVFSRYQTSQLRKRRAQERYV